MERERDVKIRIKRNYTFHPRGRKEKEVERVFAWKRECFDDHRFENRPKWRCFPVAPASISSVSPFLSFFLFHFLEVNGKQVDILFSRDEFLSPSFSFSLSISKFGFANIMDRSMVGLKYDRIRSVHENKIAINEYRLKVDETGFVESRGLDICEYAKKKKMTVCLATFRSWSRGTFDPETLLSFVGSETVLKTEKSHLEF